MKDFLPKEVATFYGVALISKMATTRNNEYIRQTPDITEKIAKLDKKTQQKSILDYSPEFAGDEDEMQRWMREGFLRPDEVEIRDPWEIIIIGGSGSWPAPPPPPPPDPCERLNERLEQNLRELAVQRWTAMILDELIRTLAPNTHPFIEWLRRHYINMLQSVHARIEELRREFALTMAVANAEGCVIKLPIMTERPRR